MVNNGGKEMQELTMKEVESVSGGAWYNNLGDFVSGARSLWSWWNNATTFNFGGYGTYRIQPVVKPGSGYYGIKINGAF